MAKSGGVLACVAVSSLVAFAAIDVGLTFFFGASMHEYIVDPLNLKYVCLARFGDLHVFELGVFAPARTRDGSVDRRLVCKASGVYFEGRRIQTGVSRWPSFVVIDPDGNMTRVDIPASYFRSNEGIEYWEPRLVSMLQNEKLKHEVLDRLLVSRSVRDP